MTISLGSIIIFKRQYQLSQTPVTLRRVWTPRYLTARFSLLLTRRLLCSRRLCQRSAYGNRVLFLSSPKVARSRTTEIRSRFHVSTGLLWDRQREELCFTGRDDNDHHLARNRYQTSLSSLTGQKYARFWRSSDI